MSHSLVYVTHTHTLYFSSLQYIEDFDIKFWVKKVHLIHQKIQYTSKDSLAEM